MQKKMYIEVHTFTIIVPLLQQNYY